ncbi:ATP-binding cassette domain-containing protein [Methylobacterium persicinum]
MSEPVLVLANARAAYGGREVLAGIDLTIRAGERVALMGRSGAGKSTLLGLIRDRIPDRVALVPQAAALVRTLSVFHNVYMGRLDRHPTLHNLRTLVSPARADVAAVETVLARVGLSDKLWAKAGELSGGSSSGSPSPAPSTTAGRSCSATSRSRPSTPGRATRCSASFPPPMPP